MRRSPGLVGLTVAASVLVVACSGDGDTSPSTASVVPVATTTSAAPTPVTSPSSTTTSVMPATPSTTMAETTTVEPTATVSETSAPSTTLPDGVPPRVTFPDDPDKQAVVDAVYAYFDALNNAQAEPFDFELRDQVLATTADPVRERVLAYLENLAAEGEAFVDLGADRSYIDIFRDVVTVVDGMGLVDACVVDRTSHVALGSNADGSDRVLDDRVFSALLSYSLNRIGEDWKIVDLSVVDQFEGTGRCAG